MNISIVGTGYVGLVTGVGLASCGDRFVCVDKDAKIVERLNSGEIHLHEEGLKELFRKARSNGLFKATDNLGQAVNDTAITIVCVGTPNKDGQIDLQYIKTATAEIGKALRDQVRYHTVVVKSTVLPGTTDSNILPILESASDKKLGEFGLGFNPEFLREGSAVSDFMEPDRIILGTDDARSANNLRELYKGFHNEKLEVNTRTAELIKYASNCLLATQISVTNEIANLAATIGGIDSLDVMRGVHLDRRWNPISNNGERIEPEILTYLVPGCGFGGSCFPKDVQALVNQGNQAGLPMHVLKGVLKTNREQPYQVVDLLCRGLGELTRKRICVLGLAFKPGTDDIRESPALVVIRELLLRGALVNATDPIACERAKKALTSEAVSIHSDWKNAVRDSDAIAILTAWDEYRNIPAYELINLMKGELVVDARNILNNSEIFKHFRVCRIGYSPT